MANYTFVANGQTVQSAIKFYPRDENGDFIAGVNLEISQGCGTISNVTETTDDSGAQCLVADYTPPASVTSTTNCTIRAFLGEFQCTCDLTLTVNPSQLNCAGSTVSYSPSTVNVGETITITYTPVDTDGNPLPNLDWVSMSTGLNIGNTTQLDDTWTITAVVTNPTVSWGVQSDNGNCDDLISFTAGMPILIDCDAITCMAPESMVVGESYDFTVCVPDQDGNAITEGLNFQMTGVTITSLPVYSVAVGCWVFEATVTSANIVGSVVSADDSVCQDFCTLTAALPVSPVINCDSIVCNPNNVTYTIGEQGEVLIRLVDTDGNEITSGVVFNASNATIDNVPTFNQLQNGWVFNVTPEATQFVINIVSNLGNCDQACTLTAGLMSTVDCENVTCSAPLEGLVIGAESQISVFVPTTSGDPVTDGVTFSFNGANITSVPQYNAATQAWVFDIIPTESNVVGSILTSLLGNCSDFCTLIAVPDGSVDCCPQPTLIDIPPLVVGEEYSGQILFEDGVTVSVNNLPNGIVFNDGTLSGTPTEIGSSEVSVVTAANCSISFRMTVVEVQQVVTDDCCPKMEAISIPTGYVGEPYSGFSTFSGTGNRVYEAINLPPGIGLNRNTGQYSGTPSATGNFNADLTVTDSVRSCTYRISFDIDQRTVETGECPEDCPRVSSIPALVGAIGEQLDLALIADDGVTFGTEVIAPGVMINASGVITGTPTAAGNFPFTVAMTSANGRECSFLTALYVPEGPEVTEGSPCVDQMSIPMCINQDVVMVVSAQGVPVDIAGDLPPGLSITGGVLTGCLTEAGDFESTVTPMNGRPLNLRLSVKDCCIPERTKSCDTPQPESCNSGTTTEYFWIQFISCVTFNGVSYKGSQECPTSPIMVNRTNRDHFLINGQAIAYTGAMK